MKRSDNFVKTVIGITILFLLLLVQSCAHYYKAVIPSGSTANDVVNNYPRRYFIYTWANWPFS